MGAPQPRHSTEDDLHALLLAPSWARTDTLPGQRAMGLISSSKASDGAGVLFPHPMESCPAGGAALKPPFFTKHRCRLSSTALKIRGY